MSARPTTPGAGSRSTSAGYRCSAGLNKGPGHEAVAWNSALIYDMIFTQPVYHEFKDLQMPTLLLIGDKDTTAIGSDIAPPEVKAKLGKYEVLGPQVAKLIPKGRTDHVRRHGACAADRRTRAVQPHAGRVAGQVKRGALYAPIATQGCSHR